MSISDAEIRSILLGMIAGFLPTNTNANGKAFDVLMKNADAKAAAQKAVDEKDDNALLGIIYEAQRHQYILPGLWRMMEEEQSLRIGTKKPVKLKKDRLLYISGMAAMFDSNRIEQPKKFIRDRPRDIYLIYGHRFHYCVGAHLSDKMMLGMFKALFSRHAGYVKGEKIVIRGNIPWNIIVKYDKEA
jgi:cytochrome P450